MEAVLHSPRVMAPADRKRTNVFGVQVDIMLRGEHTGGTFCTYEVIVPPGGGPPPHVQEREDEAFYILEGEFEILVGDRTTVVGPGAYVFLPRRVPHAFKNISSATGRLLGVASPAGHELFFEDADRLAQAGPPSPEEAVAMCRRHGMEMLLPTVASSD
jgi:mannose-6-phosphate isomerase-like protein (cupin superfamily)